MTYSPPTLRALAAFWVAQGGVNLGVVGDTRHRNGGTSYHLGRAALTLDAYSRRTPRDVAGLSEAASAIDLGQLNGSLPKLRAFSLWLVGQARSAAPGTADIREIIYSLDGRQVLRWDRERGVASPPRSGEANTSHLTHTHVSWYRDSERRDKVAIFRRYFAPTVTAPKPVVPQPMVRVEGSWWPYDVSGTRATGYRVVRGTAVTTTEFTSAYTTVIDLDWGGKPRRFAKLIDGIRAGVWVDLLDGPNVEALG